MTIMFNKLAFNQNVDNQNEIIQEIKKSGFTVKKVDSLPEVDGYLFGEVFIPDELTDEQGIAVEDAYNVGMTNITKKELEAVRSDLVEFREAGLSDEVTDLEEEEQNLLDYIELLKE